MADGLFEQLRGISEAGVEGGVPKVSSHTLLAALDEVRRGEITVGTATAALSLLAQTVTDLNKIISEVGLGNITRDEVEDVFNLVQARTIYTSKSAAATRLGLNG